MNSPYPINPQDIEKTTDGEVVFTTQLKIGVLTALVVHEDGRYSLFSMDRSKDKSTEPYLDILNRWLARDENKVFRLMTVGELSIDPTNPLATLYYLEDEPLALITTYATDYSMPIAASFEPLGTLRFLHMQHQLLDQSPVAMPKGDIGKQVANLHLYSIVRNQTKNEQSVESSRGRL